MFILRSLFGKDNSKDFSRRKQAEDNKHFDECNKRLQEILPSEVSNELVEYFQFSPKQKKAVRRSNKLVNLFVGILVQERILKPFDGTPLINGLKHFRQNALASEVEKIFRKPSSINNTLHSPVNELKRTLVDKLKQSYRLQCKEVRPFVGLHHRIHCIDEIFVDGKIQMLSTNNGRDIWEELNHYHRIAVIAMTRKLVLVEGDTGYGKSMLLLQMAYDWCEEKQQSPMAQVELLIFLQLERVCRKKTIDEAIKETLLQDDSAMTINDISTAVHSCSSVMVILDDFDRTGGDSANWTSNCIVREATDRKFPVIVTTRPGLSPIENPIGTQKMKLCGFNGAAREKYIRTALSSNQDLAQEISLKIHSNAALTNFLECPLLLSTFASMTSQGNYPEICYSLTSAFRFIISSLIGNAKNVNREEATDYSENRDHFLLAKAACDVLTKHEMTTVMSKDDLVKVIGEECYKHYTNVGILREERIYLISEDPKPPDYELCQWRTDVRFSQRVFCEWYAACYIVESENNYLALSYLKAISPVKFPNVYRFCCGLKPQNAEQIINYLEEKTSIDSFALLCRLEKDSFRAIKEEVVRICSGIVSLSLYEHRLTQKFMIEIVELASKNEIPLPCLSLINCIDFGHLSQGKLFLLSGEALSSERLQNIETLRIREEVRKLEKQEVQHLIKFVLQCTGLKNLRFVDCLLPFKFTPVDYETGTQKTPDCIQVTWVSKMSNTYKLNQISGKWMKDEKELSAMDYNRELHYFEVNPSSIQRDLHVKGVISPFVHIAY